MEASSIKWTQQAVKRLAFLACASLGSCSAYESARVVDLRPVPEAQTIRRADESTSAPLFVDVTGALVAKRQLETAISVEPSLSSYLEGELERALGVPVQSVRVDYIGYRYAYYFPSRSDDFVLEVTIDAPAAGIAGEFEGRIRGNEPADYLGELDENWIDLVPDTGAGLDEPEQTRRLEGRADQVAWQHRAKLFEVTRRLVASVE
jgi:hypothetical protein